MITKRSPSCALYFLMQVVVCVSLAAPLVTQTPAGYWPFTDGAGTKATDASGNGHAATLVNGVSWVGGQLGSGVSAQAANRQYVSIPPIDLSGTKAITVALWVNRAFSMTGGRTLFEATSDFTQSITGFGFFPDDTTCNGIQAAINGDVGETANCYAQPSSGVWHHIAVVYDKTRTGGDQVAFYVDGIFQNPTRSLFASTNSNYFGNNPIYLFSRGGMTMFDSGAIDDFRIYNGALSPAQIWKISHSSKSIQVNSGSTSRFAQGMTTTSVSGNGGGVRQNTAVAMMTAEAPTSISYVQGNYVTPQTPQSTVKVTFAAAQTAGDLNVVVVGWNDSTAAVSAVTDSKGNTYTRAVGPTVQSGIASQSIYYAKNIAAAAAGKNTVTVTFARAAKYPDIRILEYSGADPNNPVDVTAANSGSSATSSSGSATTTDATDLIFGANLVQTVTTGPGSGFTRRLLTSPDGDIAEDRTVTATGNYSATAPVSPPGQWIMQMVAFRTARNFTIAASPASLSVVQGSQGTSAITTAVKGGFNNAVTLSASGAPSGTTVSFKANPIVAPGAGSSTMTITVGDSTATGTYSITVTCRGGGIQHTATVTLTVKPAGNFTIAASPASLSVVEGSQGTSTITTAVKGGFRNAVTLSASGAPSGTTVSFKPNPIAAPGAGSSTMTLAVGASTAAGTYPITVTGSGGGIQHTATVTLTVKATANFTITALPTALSVLQGTQGTSSITTAVQGGFSNAITLSATGAPSGTTVSFSPNPIAAPGAGSSTMTITVGASTATGTYSITVTGRGGGIQHTTTVNLTVTAQVALSWTASTSPSVVGYNAYRSTISGGPYTKLNSSLISTTSYTDWAVNSGYTYYYVTTAVDSQGNESVYSNEAAATVP